MSESNIADLTAEDSFSPLDRYKRNRLSRSQFGLLVDYMTLNPELVDGKSILYSAKDVWKRKWEELAALLNADWTGVKREPAKWRKSWADQKNIIKVRAAKRDEFKALTGSDDFFKLSELEERVLKMINYYDKKEEPESVKKTANCPVNTPNLKTPVNTPNSKILVSTPNLKTRVNTPNIKTLVNTHNLNTPVNTHNLNTPVNTHNLNTPVNIHNLITPVNTHNLNAQNFQNISQQIISPSGYIVFGVGAENIPVTLTPANQSSSNMETTNVLIGLEPRNIVLTGLQSSNDKPVRVEETTISASSTSKCELNKEQKDIESSLKTVPGSSEMQAQVEKPREDSSSIIVELHPCEVSKTLGNSSSSEGSQNCNSPEIVVENDVNTSVQNLSSSPRPKKRKLSRQSFFRRRNDTNAVSTLLARQNKILEDISGTLTRIEKSVKERSSVEVQRKNDMLLNISENIQRLAESLGSVSKSIKTIADQ